MSTIQGVPDLGPGLRLHLNENTGGCSPAVLESLRRLTPEQIASYPDATVATAAAARHLGDEIQWKPGGIVESRAREVLDKAHALLREVERDTLWDAIGRGAFGDVKRTRTGGKGYAGVAARHPEYLNPILEVLERS